ncbi:DUF6240 domain-containing protein [Anaerosalibacter massiliensis]|uniref:DUF6240 domain-containing protein n=1 Tax=Anaerosalibacter massiliensis TaxID=1347392 RepID=A0A9X2MIE9_9FIRM|nr:DUF6240 domain-containing protein [Anaerosalibacter massiliensis]MCR2044289.1 DUF6240 domain-containing protein [Anaerosalibacter massiliensis]
MNSIKNINKENLVEAYGLKPNLFYDIEGTVVEKSGKDIKVESQIEGKIIKYTLKLKEEIEEDIGEETLIKKENILSCKHSLEKDVNENEIRKLEDLLKNIGIKVTKENLEIGKILLKHNIPVTKENIESFSICEKYLNEIIEKFDYDSAIKLLKKDINIEEESLQKIVEYMKEIEVEDEFSLSKLLGFKRDLSYEEAEKISVQVYGRKMGKDIYDSIIALHREGIEINKENIEKVREIVYKLHDLKDTEDKTLVKVMKKDLTPNIENIYKTKYSYSIKESEENLAVNKYDDFIVQAKATDSDILKYLEKLGLEPSKENLNLVEQFIVNNLEITVDNIEEIKYMKYALKELQQLLDEESISKFLSKGINPLEEDIRELSNIIKEDEIDRNPKNTGIDSEKVEKISEEIKSLGKVKDEDLIYLIKKGEDFKIKNLKEVSFSQNISREESNKLVDKVLKISNIIHSLEGLTSDTISFTVKRFSTVNLNNLYESEMILKENSNIKVVPVERTTENIIREEYLKAKESLSLNIVKNSIKEGLEIEYMPLDDLNNYIEKTNKYRQGENILKKINSLKGKEYDLIPIAMKNGLDISLKELGRINSFQKNKAGLGKAIDYLIKEDRYMKNSELKQVIESIEEKSKQLSNSVKNGEGKIKKEYKELIKDIEELSNSFDFKEDQRQKERFKYIKEVLDIQKSLSKDDLILEFPIAMEEGFENLQIIIPNLNKGINKDDMRFLLNVNSNNIGNIKFNLKVERKDISVEFITSEENIPMLLENAYIFEEGLKNIGYNLKSFSYENEKINKEYSLKAVDRRI